MKKNKNKNEANKKYRLDEGVTENAPFKDMAEYKMVDYSDNLDNVENEVENKLDMNTFNYQGS